MPEATQVTYRSAIIEALEEEMERDPAVIILGEDVGAAGGVFMQTEGLFKKFGDRRVIDTPISEAGAFGMAVGAAMTGLRPIFEVMFDDFMTLVMDSLVNQAAKIHFMSGGQYRVPLVLRTTMGTGANLGAQHSQSLYAWSAHVPGLKVVVPSTPRDAKALYKAAIRDDNPVVIFEDRQLYTIRGELGSVEEVAQIGLASVKRHGKDVTVVAIGRMVQLALVAAEELAAQGIQVEVIDPCSLVPLDLETIVASVSKTNRALVVDGANRQFGVSGEIASEIAQHAFDWLDAPVGRLAGWDAPIPFSRSLEAAFVPNVGTIKSSVLKTLEL